MYEKESELLGAIRRNDLSKVESIAKSGADISSPIPEARNMTPLLVAIFGHNIDIIEILLRNGADPEIPNPQLGYTFISAWSRIFEEYESWEKLERIFFLYCEYSGYKKPNWCKSIIHLIFEKGWPEAPMYFSQDV